MKYSRWSRVLSMFLAIIMSFYLLPLDSLAVEVADALAIQELPTTPTEPVDPVEEAYVLDEIEELRDADSKQFHMSDGTIVAAQYEMNVHYEDANGDWAEINNNFVYETANATTMNSFAGYATAEGPVEYKFAANTSGGNLFQVEEGEYRISFGLVQDADAELPVQPNPGTEVMSVQNPETEITSEITEIPEETEVQLQETNSTTTASSAEITILEGDVLSGGDGNDSLGTESITPPGDTAGTDSIGGGSDEQITTMEDVEWVGLEETAANDDMLSAMTVDNATSTVGYPNVYPGVSLQYVVYGNSLKEYILLKQASETYEYAFRLSLDGLVPQVQEDGSILFLDTEDDTAVYKIPAGYMSDANGAISNAVTMELEAKGNGVYELLITADAEWLNDSEREFPVAIDPTLIKLLEEETNVRASYIMSGIRNSTMNTEFWQNEHATDYSHGYMGYDSSGCGIYRNIIQLKNLPTLPSGSVICAATFNLWYEAYDSVGMSSLHINEYEVQTSYSWNHQFTWAEQVNTDYGKILDFCKLTAANAGSFIYWDITKLTKEYYEANNNDIITFALISNNESYTGSNCAKASVIQKNLGYPVLTVTYRDTRGIEGYYTYQTQSAGSAGTGYVGDYTSQLTFAENDASYSSTAMGFSIDHVYNSAYYDSQFTTSDNLHTEDYSRMKIGNGWKLSLQETVVETEIKNINSTETYLVYNDADGTEHYFKEGSTAGTYEDEDGLNLTITRSGNNFTMKDEKDNEKFFVNGYLTRIKDANGNAIYLLYNGGTYSATSTSGWYPTSGTTNKVTSVVTVQSGASTTIPIATLAYNSSYYLTSITDYAGRKKEYTYDSSGNLTQIKDCTGAGDYIYYYSYFTSNGGRLSQVYNSETKNGLAYEYRTSATGYEVSKIQSFYEDSYDASKTISALASAVSGCVSCDGSKLLETTYVDAGEDCSLTTTGDNLTVTYKFDNWGRTVNASSADGNGTLLGVTASAYTNNSGTSAKNNRLLQGASTGVLNTNLLTNPGMETISGDDATGWTRSIGSYNGCNVAARSDAAARRDGAGGMNLYIPAEAKDQAVLNQVWQSQTLTAGTEYTFSAYLKSDIMDNIWDDGGAYIAIYNSSGSIVAKSDVIDYKTADLDDGWVQVYVNYTPATTTTYKLALCQENCAASLVRFDNVQLEKGSVASNFNLVPDAGFEQTVYDSNKIWGRYNESTTITTEEKHSGSKAMKVLGSPTGTHNGRQRIVLNEELDTTYVLSGWAKADSAQQLSTDAIGGDNRFFGIVVWFEYSDDTTEFQFMSFSPAITDWQYNSKVIVPKKTGTGITVEAVTLYCTYYNNVNTAYFDDISFVKEPAQTYTYDDEGNLTAVNQGEKKVEYTYDAATSDLLKAITAGSGTYEYDYDDNHNVTSVTNDTVKMGITYTDAGETESTMLESTTNTTAKKVSTSATYSNGLLQKVVDALGNETNYHYDAKRRINDVENAKGVKSYTAYVGNLGKTLMNYISGVVSLDYAYANGLLTSVTRGGYIPGDSAKKSMAYSFLYDNFGRSTGISVANNSLATYTYDQNGSRDVESMTYGNGVVVNYVYDLLGRLTGKTYSGTNGSGSYAYDYDFYGNITRITDSTNSSDPVVYNYNYDSLGRLIRSNKKKNGDTQIRTEHQYDVENRITSQKYELSDQTTYTEAYTYDTDNGSLTKLETSKGTITFGYDDHLLRQTSRATGQFQESYAYKDVNATNTTGLLETISYAKVGGNSFSGFSLTYLYDELGNITSISGNGEVTTYTYDTQGQLLQEQTKNSSNEVIRTYTYTYDTYGNIREKKVYSGTATIANLDKTYTYTYPTSGWMDKVTRVSIQKGIGGSISTNTSFTYDAIGNPLKYYNGIAWTFTWKNGRQLATAVATGKNISYTYDVDGIRDSKTVGGVTHYYETMNGQVVRETWTQSGTTHTLDIVTDNNGNPYALVYDGTTYYYVLNAQGDVVRLVDSDGATVANYTYNAWGEILSVTNASGASITSSTHIANINPIRYRGYYYDTETGFYYLQSRYYDPAIGRFLNADKYASTGGSYLGYNMYAYCNNNPIMCVDPTGSCNCAYGPTKSDFIRANQGLPPMNCPHSVATEAVEKSGGEPTNPNIYTHCSTEHGDETLTITSLEYITLAESKLIQDELEDNNTWGFVLEKMKGALTGAVTWGVGYTLEKTTETAFTKILSKAMKIGGGSVTVVCGAWSAIDSALYTFELKRWEDANDVATEGVLKVSGTYSFESSDGGYSKSYTYYYPWDGQSEIPIPVFE